jgi:hypothetical protein
LSESVWTVIKYKPKEGCGDDFRDALKRLSEIFLNNPESLNECIQIDSGEYVQIIRSPSIDALLDGQEDGLNWLDSVEHLLEMYEDESRTDAFSGVALEL